MGQAMIRLALVLMLQTTIWLDLPPTNWNVPGAPIPTAGPAPASLSTCSASERDPATPEESWLAALGWRLETYWSPIGAPDALVILATAGYDGMCRPWQFNAFVFSNGQFAGTLSPDPMLSRQDGVLVGSPLVLPDGGVEAEFIRYKPGDPLCCPSAGRGRVLYALEATATGPLVVPLQIIPEAPVAAPAQVPQPDLR